MQSSKIKEYAKFKNIFEVDLKVNLISEKIVGCDIEDDPVLIKKEMLEKDFDIYGVKSGEDIVGYLERDKLTKEKIKESKNNFTLDTLLSDSTPLLELLVVFLNRDYSFILEKDKVTKIVTIADLHKPPVRMLVFSLISLLEMYMTQAIKEFYPEESWKDTLKTKRIDEARKTLDERKKQNEALTLLDNIQMCDKRDIIAETSEIRNSLGYMSKKEWRCFLKEVEKLRNNTAHSQKAIYHDNKALIKLILEIKEVLEVANKEMLKN